MRRLPRRRALIVGLAGVLAACSGPTASRPTPVAAPPEPTSAPPPPATPTPRPAPPSPTPAAAPALASTATPAATQTPATVEPEAPPEAPADQVTLDVRLLNGSADVQIDGRSIEPGLLQVAPGPHQLAALVDDEVVAVADAPEDGGSVELVVPPPLAGLAIMIENQADARPQTGLTRADVVYEALAEGGITRFIAVFLSGDAAVVGPVRSLRHYFAFMAAEYGADVVHIGASPEGFAWRDAMNMGHLDESAGDPGVWRIASRRAPHNAYTDTSADRDFLAQRGSQQNHLWGPLLFDPRAPSGQATAANISLGFGSWAYRVDYAWDDQQARYLRNMEGAPHRDASSGEQIAPATVIVQFAEFGPIPNDDKLRLDVSLIDSSGQLVVFSSGTRREGTWSKSGPDSPSLWLDDQGQLMVIPPGPVWVEVAPLGSPLSSA